jgi:hypothetical protein
MKDNARPRRSPLQAVEGLLALDGVLQVRVDAPRSISPHLETGRDGDRDKAKHQKLLEIAMKISELADESVSVKLDDIGVKSIVDTRGYSIGALFQRGPIAKSIQRSLRNALRNWPG